MPDSTGRWMRIVVNGKKASDPALREAVSQIRQQGHRLDVRVTWEGGDAARYAGEAVEDQVDVVIAAGGDGTINEVANGLLQVDDASKIAVGILPYGTANDFATGCGIPKGDPLAALTLVAENEPVPIDIGKVNDQYFVNVASGGFGAEVTTATPPDLKKAIGGAAYALTGIVAAAKMSPYRGKLITPDSEEEGEMIIGAVGNGRLAGGGFPVCPKALLNDGLLDVMAVHDLDILDLGPLVNELMNMDAEGNRLVSYRQLPSFEIHTERPLQLNLDGEPIQDTSFRFEALPRKLAFVLPPSAALTHSSES